MPPLLLCLLLIACTFADTQETNQLQVFILPDVVPSMNGTFTGVVDEERFIGYFYYYKDNTQSKLFFQARNSDRTSVWNFWGSTTTGANPIQSVAVSWADRQSGCVYLKAPRAIGACAPYSEVQFPAFQTASRRFDTRCNYQQWDQTFDWSFYTQQKSSTWVPSNFVFTGAAVPGTPDSSWIISATSGRQFNLLPSLQASDPVFSYPSDCEPF